MVPSHLVQITKYQHIHVRCANISICVRLKMQLVFRKKECSTSGQSSSKLHLLPGSVHSLRGNRLALLSLRLLHHDSHGGVD